ncbi:MAG: HAD family hydrolase [Candidatus Hodarchaeota archaeon]
MSHPIKLLIFDLDDTLIKSNIDYSQIRREVVELFDNPIPEETIIKTPILKLLDRLKEVHPNKYPEGYKRVYETEREATEQANIIEGAEKIPALLKKHRILSAIYTNNSLNTVKLYLAKPGFKFLHRFQIHTREDFTNPKPDPEGLIKIISLFQKPEITRENTAYIGDSYIDAFAAHNANVKFIWFNSRDVDSSLFPAPPYAVLTNWENFENFLRDRLS